MIRGPLLCATLFLFMACSEKALDVGSDKRVIAGDAGDCRPYSPPNVCSQNRTGNVITLTKQAFSDAIAHRWLLCEKPSIFGRDGDDIGLEILPDGTWYKLYLGHEGSTVRGAGFDQEGKWEMILVPSGNGSLGDSNQPYQLNFNIFGSATLITHPALASTPIAMRLSNNGVFVGNYVLDSSVPEGTARCPSTPDPTETAP